MIGAMGARPAATQAARHPQHGPRRRRTALHDLAVLVAISGLLVGCASPTPSPSGTPGASTGPATSGSPTETTAPSATPGVTPLPTEPPDTGEWAPVDATPAPAVATLVAARATSAGVHPASSFTLTALDGSDAVALAKQLVAEPSVTFTASAGPTRDTAVIRPRGGLEPGGVYRVRLVTQDGTVRAAWAVQAVGPLHVSHTIPGNESTDTPLDAGIEITFDQAGVTPQALEQHLQIVPAITGHVEASGRMLAFVPERPLAKATLYMVTVTKGLPLGDTGMTLEQPYTFAFETGGAQATGRTLSVFHTLVQASPSERPMVVVGVEREEIYDENGEYVGPAGDVPTQIAVNAWRLASVDAAVDAWAALRRSPEWARHAAAVLDTTSLPRVLTGNVPMHPVNGTDDWQYRVQLPNRLAAGYYLVQVTLDDMTRSIVLEVTRLAVFTLVTETDTAAWVNDTVTGSAIGGAAITILGTRVGTTGANGVATGPTPSALLAETSEAQEAVLIARSGSRSVFVPVGENMCAKCDAGSYGAMTDRWWHIFSLNRSQYRSTDTVLAWGVVRNRATGAVPASVTVRLQAWSDITSETTDLGTYKATPDAAGVFTLRIPFKDLPPDDYAVRLDVDGAEIASQGITVAPITKPSWSMTMRLSRHAMLSGGSVLVGINGRFFEGTPVAGAKINVTTGDSDAHGTLTTDLAGAGSLRLRIPWSEDYSDSAWYISYIHARPATPEEGSIETGADIALFRATVLPKVTVSSTEARVLVSGTVNDVAFSRFEDPDLTSLYDVDPYGSVRGGGQVQLHTVRNWTTTYQSGTTYDFITKRTVPVYETEEHSRDLGWQTVVADARGRFSFRLPALAANERYEMTVRAQDAAGRWAPVNESAYTAYPDETPNTWTSIEPSVTAGEDDGADPEAGIGETVGLDYTGGVVQTAGKRVLWLETARGLTNARVLSSNHYDLTFGASDVPLVRVDAVRWTGHVYETPASRNVWFRSEDRRLNVAVTADKTSYRPGGRATVNVRVTDANGQGVAASVYLRVIDAKLFAMGIADAGDALGELYANPGSGVLKVAWSHFDPTYDDGGKGDTTGGGDDYRDDFRDWLDAVLVSTDASGRASRSFDLSDDLTSWRVLVSAVTTNLEAGDGTVDLPVSLPFFAEATVAAEYLVADQPVIAVRGYGTGLHASDVVTFTISSPTLPMAAVSVRASAFMPAEVALPALSAGRHTLRIEAKTGSGDALRVDRLERTFTVIETRARQITTTSSALTGSMSIPAGTGLTTLVLADGGRGRVLPALMELREASPTRGDRLVAAALAERVLVDRFGLAATGAGLSDISPFLSEYDALQLVPWGDADLQMTVLAAMAHDPRIHLDPSYFDDREDPAREQSMWILVGRAAIGQPVIADLRAAAELGNLTTAEEIVIGLGAVAAGDDDLASRMLSRVLAIHAQRQGPFARVLDEGGKPSAVLTSRLAIIAASLGDPIAADLDAWVVAHPPADTLLDLERALAAAGWANRVPATSASAILTVDGRATTLSIERGEAVTMRLTPAQAATATLVPGTGSVVVSVLSDRALDPASITPPTGVSIERRVVPEGAVKATDIVVVTLHVRLPSSVTDLDGCWLVTELAPSGLAPIWNADGADYEGSDEVDTSNAESPSSVTGQVVRFCVTPDVQRPTHVLRYVARVVTPGSYAWEPAVLQSTQDASLGAVVPATRLVINRLTAD